MKIRDLIIIILALAVGWMLMTTWKLNLKVYKLTSDLSDCQTDLHIILQDR